MADYYTSFSCLLDVGSTDNVVRALALYADSPADDDGKRFPDGFAAEVDITQTSCLWLHDDGHGDIELLIRYALVCAEQFDLSGLWGFEYAFTCSRPLLGTFGGGAHVVDLGARTSHDWVNTIDWMAKVLAGDDPDA